MRLGVVVSLLLLGLVPAAGARMAGKTWASGVISKVSPASISVRGAITIAVPDGANGTKTTLDGTRLLTCDVAKAGLVHGFHVGGKVKVTCSNGTLLQIAHL